MKNFQELANGRWFTFSLAEQLGNIGSEVGSAIHWKNKGDTKSMWSALERGLELFDLTIADPRRTKSQLKEICRAREVVCDYLVGDNEYRSDDNFLNDYFM